LTPEAHPWFCFITKQGNTNKINNAFKLFQLVRSHKSEKFKDVRALCSTVIDSGHARLISEPATLLER